MRNRRKRNGSGWGWLVWIVIIGAIFGGPPIVDALKGDPSQTSNVAGLQTNTAAKAPSSQTTAQQSNQTTALPDRTSCFAIEGTQYRSETEQAFYLTSCVHRTSCAQITGTQYRNTEERTWYLANCITAQPSAPPATVSQQKVAGLQVWKDADCASAYSYTIGQANQLFKYSTCLTSSNAPTYVLLYGVSGTLSSTAANPVLTSTPRSSSGSGSGSSGGGSCGAGYTYIEGACHPNIPYAGNGGGPTLCNDGTVSNSSGSGTCSHHGGIDR